MEMMWDWLVAFVLSDKQQAIMLIYIYTENDWQVTEVNCNDMI